MAIENINCFVEGGGKSGSSGEDSGSEDGEFKHSSNKLGEEISVFDLLEKAKQQDFKVF